MLGTGYILNKCSINMSIFCCLKNIQITVSDYSIILKTHVECYVQLGASKTKSIPLKGRERTGVYQNKSDHHNRNQTMCNTIRNVLRQITPLYILRNFLPMFFSMQTFFSQNLCPTFLPNISLPFTRVIYSSKYDY